MGIFQYEYFYVYDWLEKTRPSSRLNTQSVVPKNLLIQSNSMYQDVELLQFNWRKRD